MCARARVCDPKLSPSVGRRLREVSVSYAFHHEPPGHTLRWPLISPAASKVVSALIHEPNMGLMIYCLLTYLLTYCRYAFFKRCFVSIYWFTVLYIDIRFQHVHDLRSLFYKLMDASQSTSSESHGLRLVLAGGYNYNSFIHLIGVIIFTSSMHNIILILRRSILY